MSEGTYFDTLNQANARLFTHVLPQFLSLRLL